MTSASAHSTVPAVAETATPILELRSVSKSFGGEHALADVDLVLTPGEIRGLVGPNGSGKSTLVKVLAGLHKPDAGSEVRVDGDAVHPADGDLEGFRFVHQDLALIPEFTVAENITLSAFARPGAKRLRPLSDRSERAEIRTMLDGYDLTFAADTLVRDLSAAEQTMVAVVRAFHDASTSARVLVLDEVTSRLPPAEVDRLLATIRQLVPAGIAVLFVSHSLDQILALCDTITVLRDGRVVGDQPVAGVTEHDLVRLITGRPPEALYPDLPRAGRAARLTVDGLGGGLVDDFTAAFHEGEITGLVSLDPAEPSQVLRLIHGVEQRARGEVRLAGGVVKKGAGPDVMQTLGVSLVTGHLEAGINEFDLRENMTLAGLRPFFRGLRLRKRPERAAAAELIAAYEIVPADSGAAFSALSGGNRQKAILARSMRLDLQVLLLDNPTLGVDVGAKVVLYRIVERAASDGLTVLITSTDVDELCGICHRVLVLKDGRINAVLHGRLLTPDNVLEHCYVTAPAAARRESDLHHEKAI